MIYEGKIWRCWVKGGDSRMRFLTIGAENLETVVAFLKSIGQIEKIEVGNEVIAVLKKDDKHE